MIIWQDLLSLKGYHKTRNDSSLNWLDVATHYLGGEVRGRSRGRIGKRGGLRDRIGKREGEQGLEWVRLREGVV